MRTLALTLLTLALAAPAFAADGVLEINQSCAVNTGCFPGDTPGFPVTIDGQAGRSYQLTGDLIVPDENTTGILVAGEDNTVDLNGHSIRGVTVCDGLPVTSCSPTGSGIGVHENVVLPFGRRTTVRDGSIVGMGNRGLSLGDTNRVLNVSTSHNGDRGIAVGQSSVVIGNTARQNGAIGISANFGSVVSRNAVRSNGGDGISASESRVSGNVANENGGFGLLLLGASGYDNNTVNGNTSGTVSGGIDAGGNLCNFTLGCP